MFKINWNFYSVDINEMIPVGYVMCFVFYDNKEELDHTIKIMICV